MISTIQGKSVSIAALAVSLAWAQAAAAEEAVPASEADAATIVVTGSRFGGRTAEQSLTPVSSVTREVLTAGGATQLQDMLKLTVPAFSTPRPSTSGPQDFITPPTLRGLSTGQVLMLLNGKRRHVSASLNISQQIGRGDVAYDFTAIPALALSRVEVLRDGASAQYGSDAIAGVINLLLDDRIGFDGEAGYRKTTRGDGGTWAAAIAGGFAIGNGGVIRVTAEYQNQNRTDRARPDTRQQYFGTSATGAPLVPSANFGSGTGLTPSNGRLDPREATFDRNVWSFGQPAYEARKIFVNARLPVASDATELYAFGGYSDLDGTSLQFFRRAGQDETVRAIFPDGFLPKALIGLKNWSATAGVRGEAGGFGYDLSTGFGQSREDYGLANTNNVSLGAASPTRFDRGANRFRQWTSNLDLTREIDLGDGAPLKLALGAEYREEYFDIIPGEPDSYRSGGAAIVGGPNAGRPGPIGAQPGGTIPPADATDVSRHSKAVYAEISKMFFDRLTLDGAVRYADFSDFGDTLNYKVAGRLEIIPGMAFRASYNTGFRAPALQQSFARTTSVNFANGVPTTTRVVSTNDSIAPLIGADPLKREKSRNVSAGAVFSPPGSGFTLTMDYYRVEIDDRIAISSNFSSAALTNLLAANGAPGVQTVAFLTNAVDTTTQGVDLSATWRVGVADGTLAATLGATISDTDFRRIAGTPAPLAAIGIGTVLFDLTQQVRTTDSIPRDKATLALNWEKQRFGFNLVNTYYGSVAQVALAGRTAAQVAALSPGFDVRAVPANAAGMSFDLVQRFKGQIVTDIEAHYRLTPAVTLSIGADNIFDLFPEKQLASTAASVAAGTNGGDNAGIFPYAYIAPYGVNGATLYGRVRFSF